MRGVSRVCKHVRVTAALSRQGGTNCLPPTTPAMPLESCQSWFSVGATISDRRVQFTGQRFSGFLMFFSAKLLRTVYKLLRGH